VGTEDSKKGTFDTGTEETGKERNQNRKKVIKELGVAFAKGNKDGWLNQFGGERTSVSYGGGKKRITPIPAAKFKEKRNF